LNIQKEETNILWCFCVLIWRRVIYLCSLRCYKNCVWCVYILWIGSGHLY